MLVGAGSIFATVGTVGIAAVAAGSTFSRSIPLVLVGLVPGVFALIGFGLLFWVARDARRRRLLGTPTLALPRTEPLALGTVLVARFERSGGSRRGYGSARMTAELVCTERATYRQGTDTHTATREVRRSDLAVWLDRAANPVSGRIRMEVPVHGPPSMSLSHNEIAWTVRVAVRAEGLPDGTAVFPVTVLPFVALRAPAVEPAPR